MLSGNGIFTGPCALYWDASATRCEPPAFELVAFFRLIEHVGSRARQRQMWPEVWRVARRGVCVTTPNAGYGEFHTQLPR